MQGLRGSGEPVLRPRTVPTLHPLTPPPRLAPLTLWGHSLPSQRRSLIFPWAPHFLPALSRVPAFPVSHGPPRQMGAPCPPFPGCGSLGALVWQESGTRAEGNWFLPPEVPAEWKPGNLASQASGTETLCSLLQLCFRPAIPGPAHCLHPHVPCARVGGTGSCPHRPCPQGS